MLRHGRWGEALVAAAGPLSNLGLAILAAIVVRLFIAPELEPTPVLEFVAS